MLTELQTIQTNESLTIDERLEAILALGTDLFQQEIGIISQVVDEAYTVRHVVTSLDGISAGDQFPLRTTYCNLTLSMPIPVAIAHASTSEYVRHPCYESFKLESYLGAAIRIDRVTYGTVNFSSPNPHARFTTGERAAISEMARVAAQLIVTQNPMWG